MKVPLTLRDHLDRALAVYPDRTAFVDEPDQPAPSMGEITFSRLGELADATGAGLDALGVGMGGRVAMVSHNAGRLLTCFWGVSGNGRIFVPINFRLSLDEVSYIVEHCGADVLLVDPELADVLGPIPCRHKFVLGDESDEAMFRFGDTPQPWTPDEDGTAVINYTSGTTARPKGVQQTHRSLWLNAAMFGWQASVSDRDTYLHTLPMFHCNGWGMPYALVGMGAKQIVLRKVDGAEILRRVGRARHHPHVRGAGGGGGHPRRRGWLGRSDPRRGPHPHSGRRSAPAHPHHRAGRDRAGLGVHPHLRPHRDRPAAHHEPQPGRVGPPLAGRTGRKLSRQGVPALGVRMRVSASGEFLTRCNHVLEGYWEQPQATEEAIVDGWFHTGDGGYLDDDGYYMITDRKKDVIISGGENVSSIEVEDALFSHPAVAEVAVIGVPHEKWGETVKALVVLAPGAEATSDDLIDHCRERIARYKCPTSVEFRSELARTATGKLQKFKLRAPYWEGMSKAVN